MKQFNYLIALPFSFFSIALYRDIGSRWKGVGFAYLSILAFFSVLVTMSLIAYTISDFIDEWAEETDWGGARTYINEFLDQTPDMMIQENQIILADNVELPYSMKLDLSGLEEDDEPLSNQERETLSDFPLIVFNDFGDADMVRELEIPVLITKDTILINNTDENRIEVYYVSDIMDGIDVPQPYMLNAELAKTLGDKAFTWLLENKSLIYTYIFTFYAIGGLILAFMLNILYGILMGGLGVFIGFITRVPMTFGVAFRLGCVALTPLVFFNIAMFYFNQQGFSFLEQLGIMAMYMLLAVLSCRNVELQRD